MGVSFVAIFVKFKEGNDFLIRIKISNVTIQEPPFKEKATTRIRSKRNILKCVIAEKKLPPHKLPCMLTLEKVSENKINDLVTYCPPSIHINVDDRPEC